MPSSKWFSAQEMACTCCGAQGMQAEVFTRMDEIRGAVGFPLVVSSGYRCQNHPAERHRKAKGNYVLLGEHAQGYAVDILCHGHQASLLLMVAQIYGVKRIGINQKGPIEGRFIHLGFSPDKPTPALWTY